MKLFLSVIFNFITLTTILYFNEAIINLNNPNLKKMLRYTETKSIYSSDLSRTEITKKINECHLVFYVVQILTSCISLDCPI